MLAEESWQAVDRYKQVKAAYPIQGRAGMTFSDFGGVALAGGVPYFVVYQNVAANPRQNYVSFNSPTVKASEAGPNGRNNLDPNAPGAIMGLDPREAVAWSTDGGASWGWGREVGGGSIWGDYTGSSSSDDGTRLPWYAWQEQPGGPLRSNQPFYSYPDSGKPGRFTLRVKDAPRRTVLTEAGGYATVGNSVGVVTVTNLRTGQRGTTPQLGTGIAKGPLTPSVAIEPGDSYEIAASGTVWKAEGDQFLQAMGLVGPGKTPWETPGHGYDRAELFATPHPWQADAGGPGGGGNDGGEPTKPRPPKRPKARVALRSVALTGARLARRRSQLRVRGRVNGAVGAARPTVAIQVRRRGRRWHTVARGRVTSSGVFALRRSVPVRGGARRLQVRASVKGVGLSRPLAVRVPRR